ncbi:FYVE zinc finger domain-containing protein [Phytophthora infestans]|uniref:FYVE zinc finger domain-containing protein n=1 Tax=Phytophthora infestans TaxID=4787 RepID=A0A833SQB9_PHYIN|nr:FYVE zinc finger domain-containing protein [Phytophthora infestans]
MSSRPSWGVSGGALLSSQVPEQTINFHKTLRPFEEPLRFFDQTMRPSHQSMRLSQQIKPRARQSVDFSKEIRPATQRSRQSLQPSQRVQQRPHPLAQPSLREPRSSERPPRRSKPRQPSQPPQPTFDQTIAPRRGLTLSELATEHKSKRTGRQYSTRPSLDVSLGLPRGAEKTAAAPPQGRLSSVQRREIMDRVGRSVKKVMSSMLPGDKNDELWKTKFQKKNTSYYADETSVKPGQTRFCCVSHTHATVDEIMSLFIPTDVDSVLHNNKLVFDNVIDAKIVSVLRRPTRQRPMHSLYLRYSTFQTPGPLANRDMCVAVATDMFRQPDGSTIGYCMWDSVDDLEFLDTVKQPGFDVCTMFRSGFFFRHPGRTTGDSMQGQTKMIYMVGLETGAWASGLTARLRMEKHGSTLERVRTHFRRKYLDPSTFVIKTEWESKCAAKSCKQCDKTFQVLSNRVNCHACGHVVCRSCVSKESVEVHTVGLVPIHVCFWCLEKAGLPAPASTRKTRASLRQRRHQSETASAFRQTISVVYTDVGSDEDTDDGEWAITTMGVPVRPSRMAAYV